METLIAMQDMRTELSAIADRAAAGEMFIVLRNSRPAFRILPFSSTSEEVPPPTVKSFSAIRKRMEARPVSSEELTPTDLKRVIREVRKHKAQA
jgi:antitoxin (DNA-binding transcriptional repressor) of toxin-antitoxin stability system